MPTRSPIRRLLALAASAASAPLLVLLACSAPSPADELASLRERARAAHDQRLERRGDVLITTETTVGVEPGQSPRYLARIQQRGDSARLEAWLGEEQSSWGWVQISSPQDNTVWPLDKFGWEELEPGAPLQVPALRRWFDLWSMDHGTLGPAEVHGGRACRSIQLPVVQVEGQDAYLLDGRADLAAAVRDAEAAGLQVIRVEQLTDGRSSVFAREGLGPALDYLRATDQVLTGQLWVIEAEAFLEYRDADAVAHSASGSPPAAAGLTTFEVFSSLCVDDQTLQPVRVEGVLRDYRHHQRRAAALVWSDHREVDGEVVAHQLDLLVGDTVFATTRVTSWQSGVHHDEDTFDAAQVGRYLDLKAQRDNTRSVLNYIEAGTHDGTETEDPDDPASRQRDELFQPAALLERLGIGAGDVVADVAAGTGYFTFRLARAVGPSGTVYAVDVNPHAVSFIEARGADRSLNPHDNVRCVVNEFDDATLAEASVDLGFVCWAFLHRYHHLTDVNQRLLQSFYRACRPGGRWAVLAEHADSGHLHALPLGLAVLEPGRQGTGIGTLTARGDLLERHGRTVVSPAVGSDGLTTSARCLRQHYEAAGFRFTENIELVEGHDLLVFERAR